MDEGILISRATVNENFIPGSIFTGSSGYMCLCNRPSDGSSVTLAATECEYLVTPEPESLVEWVATTPGTLPLRAIAVSSSSQVYIARIYDTQFSGLRSAAYTTAMKCVHRMTTCYDKFDILAGKLHSSQSSL